MNAKRWMAGALALAILGISAPAGATHAWTTTCCTPFEKVHWYGVDPPAPSTQVTRSSGWSGTVVPLDLCPLGAGVDGEHEGGFGGSVFPAGTGKCLLLPEVAHHGFGVGAHYWAIDDFGATIVYAAGADGPANVQEPTSVCSTDGVITDDPVTDPLDCGSGGLGIHDPPSGTWLPATLGENVPGTGACDPYDGYVTVAVFVGAGPWKDGVVVSTPAQGDVWG